MSVVTIKRAGLLSTIQDVGRFNLRHLGIPWSGCLVPAWQKIANALTGNPHNQSVIEIWEGGLEIAVTEENVRFALCAHESVDATLSDGSQSIKIQPNRSYKASAGSSIQIKSTGEYRHAIIAFSGLSVSDHLGSTSTYSKASLGGLKGTALQAGDEINVSTSDNAPDLQCHHSLLGTFNDCSLRIVLGPQEDHFSEEGIDNLLSGDFTLGTDADRMGVRLSGPTIHHRDAAAKDIVSDAIVPGSIQVPGTGQPIVLLSDAHTAGGYPKVATVLSIDQPKLGLRRAGTCFNFKAISMDEAIDAVRMQHQQINDAIDSLTPVVNTTLSTTDLLKHNLIDGVIDGRAH